MAPTYPIHLVFQLQESQQFSSVQSLSHVQLFASPWTHEFTQTHVHWVGDAIQPFHPLSSPSPPAFNLSQHQGLFQWVSSLHQVAKGLEFQLQISPSNEYSALISSRMDWLDLLAVQGSLESSPTPQFKSINSLVLSIFYNPILTFIYDYLKKT